jgi:hypothetical protein
MKKVKKRMTPNIHLKEMTICNEMGLFLGKVITK